MGNDTVNIDSERVFATLKRLIEIKSVSGNEEEIAAFIKNFLNGLGLSPVIVSKADNRPNIICTIGESGPLIGLMGHMDTVDVLDEDHWTQDPFTPWEDERFIYGRGAFDMKCGLAAMMCIAELLAKSPNLNCRLMLMFVCDEEKSAEFGTKTIIQRIEKGMIEKPDFVINGEESHGHIRNAERGMCKLKVSFFGKSSHTSQARRHGVNAIVNASRGVLELEKDIDHFHECVGRPLLSVNSISTENETNKVPAECSTIIDARIVPGMSDSDLIALVMQRLDPLKKKYKDSNVPFNYTIDVLKYTRPTLTPLDHPLVAKFSSVVESITGSRPACFVKDCGCTDNRLLRKADIPCIVFGPEGYADHGPDERVDKRSVMLMTQAYLDFILDF